MSIVIAEKVTVTLLQVRGCIARLGIEAPHHLSVDRMEVHERKLTAARPPPKVQKHSPDITILTLTGNHDAHLLTDELDQTNTYGHVLLDFCNIFKVSAAEVAALVLMNNAMKVTGGRLTLFNLTPDLRQILDQSTMLRLCR